MGRLQDGQYDALAVLLDSIVTRGNPVNLSSRRDRFLSLGSVRPCLVLVTKCATNHYATGPRLASEDKHEPAASVEARGESLHSGCPVLSPTALTTQVTHLRGRYESRRNLHPMRFAAVYR